MDATSAIRTNRRTQRIPRADRESQLLDIAEDLFARHGYEVVSIEDVARQAGVTRPVVYQRFGSKEGLYLACVRRARTEFEQGLLAAVDGVPDLPTQLLRGGDAFFEILERDPRRWAIVFGVQAPLQGEFGSALTELRRGTVAQIGRLLRAFLPDVAPSRLDAVAHMVSGAGEQLGRWWLANPDVPRSEVSESFRDFAIAGVSSLLEVAG